ncbi:MAG: autophagy protein atg9 [Pycnora praestabilis]|nr:MAG: autophagy protein atg9 [Pycnora praestabilis]
MASNLLSRFLSPTAGSPSVYETLRQHDESSDTSDVEERAGMTLDEENLGEGFHDYELDHEMADAAESHITTESAAFLGRDASRPQQHGQQQSLVNEGQHGNRSSYRSKWMQNSPGVVEADEADDEVPASLLIEGEGEAAVPLEGSQLGQPNSAPFTVSPVPGPSTRETRAQWQATQAQQRLHQDGHNSKARRRRAPGLKNGLAIIDPKEKALWRWANVENLDNFLKDIYDYFLGNGIWCIMLSRVLNLLTLGFVVGFSTFLSMCVNYKKVPHSSTMSDILIPKCTKQMSALVNLLLWLFTFFWIAKLFQYLLDIRRLRHLHDFYHHLLDISDTDIQTISWQEVVARLMLLRDSNPVTADGIAAKHRRFIGSQSKQRMDAHDIANRLMRKENYLIALFNKDILDLTLPIPFFANRQLFSKTMEWNLNLCVLDYVFNEQGQVRPLFLKDTHRRALSDGLRRRFLFAGVMNVVCAPFIVIYFMMLYFFRYFNEYQKNPSQLGSRQYTPLAEWKFREFNELWHLFQRRVNMSYPFASRYVDQFPKDKTIQLSRFVAFVTGALASVLFLASVIDPELFLGFEVTPGRTVLFYLSVFGSVWAVARGMVPEDNLVFDPEYALNNVIEYTHYLPALWRGRLHSDSVKQEFSMLYKMKVVIFMEEILSIIFTPFVLWFSLPRCSDRLVDFFREFTVHVDGLGYVCSFAVFDFKKGGNNTAQQQQQLEGDAKGLRDDYYSTKDGKMLASYYGFLDNYATNPRPGPPHMHPAAKRQFHPPPSFPGLMSPTLAAEMSGPGSGRQDRWSSQHRAGSQPANSGAGALSMHRNRRIAPAGTTASPMPSMLLDPHHQPSTSGFRTMSRQTPQSRFRTTRHQLTEPIEDDEDVVDETKQAGAIPSDSAGGLGDQSNLGESWKTTRAAALEEEDDEEEDTTTVAGGKGAGVLGLLYQFQKAQPEGRGTGVNI